MALEIIHWSAWWSWCEPPLSSPFASGLRGGGPVGPARPHVCVCGGEALLPMSGPSEALHDLVPHRRQGSPTPRPHFACGRMGDGEPTESALEEGRAPL